MYKSIIIVALTLSVISISCVDPITLESEGQANVLVVEGGITTDFGPHNIKLTNSAKYGTVFDGVVQNVSQASVFITDELGNIVRLEERGSGNYETPGDFRGEVGRSYTLIIETRDGKEYISSPEVLNRVSVIDSLYFEYKKTPVINELGNDEFVSGVNVFAVMKDEGESRNYYNWKTNGTYRIKTNPELYTPPRSTSPVPKDCCDICYITETNESLEVVSDRLFDGNEYIHNVFFVEDDGARFSDKYVLNVEQFSLTKNAYDFYSLLNSQLQIKGDIFDPPPAEIGGNVICITNPQEKVIGYFTASDVKRKVIEINGLALPELKRPPLIPDDCRVLKNASTDVPYNW